jgi:hypothetical protein
VSEELASVSPEADEPVVAQNFPWTAARAKAAELCAMDVLTDEKIAAECHISRRTLTTWKQHPEFRARRDSRRAELLEEAKAFGIASQRARLESQQDRYLRMHQVITERAADPTYAAQPGWKTGLLVHDFKTTKDDAFDVFKVDDGLLGELRALEAQVAKELGQSVSEKAAAAKPSAKTSTTFNADGTVEFTLEIGEAGAEDDE